MTCIVGAAFFRRHYGVRCENRHCMAGTQTSFVSSDQCPDDHERIRALLLQATVKHGLEEHLPCSLLSSDKKSERDRYHDQKIAMVVTFYDPDGYRLEDRIWVGMRKDDEFFFGPPEMKALLDPKSKRRVVKVKFSQCFGAKLLFFGRDGQYLHALPRRVCVRGHAVQQTLLHLQTSEEVEYSRSFLDFSSLTIDSFEGDPDETLCIVQ